MTSGARCDVRHTLPGPLRRVDGISVVLANEEHWHGFQGGEIEALVEDAFIGCTIAEKAHDNAIEALKLHGVGVPDGVGNCRAHHR